MNNTLVVVLMPELSEQKKVKSFGFRESVEYINVALEFVSKLMMKADFAEVAMLLS